MPDQYFGVALYYLFIFHYRTSKIMKFIPHMWAGKSLQWILMRLPDQSFLASAGPVLYCTVPANGIGFECINIFISTAWVEGWDGRRRKGMTRFLVTWLPYSGLSEKSVSHLYTRVKRFLGKNQVSRVGEKSTETRWLPCIWNLQPTTLLHFEHFT